MERAELKAYVQSPGGWGWVGDARHHQRYAKPVDKPAVKKTEKPAATRAPEIDKKQEAPKAAANGQYVILVGAFANPDNVKKLLIRIKGVGVPTYTEILNSPAGKRTRVRGSTGAGVSDASSPSGHCLIHAVPLSLYSRSTRCGAVPLDHPNLPASAAL